MKIFLTSAYFNQLIKLIFYVVFLRVHAFVCLLYIRMKSKSIHIPMEVEYFDYNAHNVFHIFVQLHLRTNSFITFYIIELNSILS